MRSLRFMLLAVFLFAAAAFGEEVGSAPPGRYDEQAVRLLREATATLKLKKTTLAEVAPAYAVERGDSTSWEDALADAEQRFGNDVDRRALFLRKFIPREAPAARLQALKLPDTGIHMGTGSGTSVSYGLGVTYQESQGGYRLEGDKRERLTVFTMRIPHAKATLTYWVAREQVLGPAVLSIKEVEVGGIHYRLSFDSDDRLASFARDDFAVTPEVTIRIGGNTSMDGPYLISSYYAWVTPKEGPEEQIDFSPDLVIRRRAVSDPKTHKTIYTESYEGGNLRRRSYHAERKTPTGAQDYIERMEEF